MGRARKFPGETKEERAAWRVAWARYLDSVNYPKELRIPGQPDFEGLRKLFIRTRQNELKKYADDINHVNARVKELLPLAGQGKVTTGHSLP